MNFKDLTGQRFGRLVVIKRIENSYSNARWLCKCDCGGYAKATTIALHSGNTKSCGCFQREQTSKARKKHNLSKARLFRIWECMKTRTQYKRNDNYSFYGGRGISVCEEWKNDSYSFIEWALKNGYNDKLSLDRIDVNGNYSPDNCRWITHKEQCRNKRNNKNVNFEGKSLCVSELAELYGIKYGTLWARLKRGMDIKEALKTPIRKYLAKS